MPTVDADRVEALVGYVVQRAQYALRPRMDEALRELGPTTAQFAALSALDEAPGLSGAEPARRGFVTPQTMHGVVAHLEAAGLLERRPHPEHGRILRGYPTGSRREAHRRPHGRVRAIARRTVAPLDEPERKRLVAALRRCIDALEADEAAVSARPDGGTPAVAADPSAAVDGRHPTR